MHLKLLRAAAVVAVLGGTATFGLGSTQAALALTNVSVPCNTSDLVTDMTAPVNHTVLILAPDCTYLVTAQLPTVANSLTIAGHNASIVRSHSAGAFSIFDVGSVNGNLTLENVNVRNGGGDQDDGGAIYIDPGTVTIYGGTFSDNSVNDYGGAIYNYHGTLTVDGATFTGNGAEYGGAIYSENNVSTATLNHDNFIGNTADEGGAIDNADNDMTIGHSNFRYDSADYGAAIYNDSDVTVNDTLFSMNTAFDEGGGIYNDGETVTLNHSLITVNFAEDGGGGGIYNDDDGTVTLSFDLINANTPNNCDPTGTIDGCVG